MYCGEKSGINLLGIIFLKFGIVSQACYLYYVLRVLVPTMGSEENCEVALFNSCEEGTP